MNFSKVLKEIYVFSPVKIIAPFIGIVTLLINTRFFHQEEYGLLNLITSTISLINTLIFGWIGYVLVRYYHKYKRQENLSEFLSTIWVVTLVLCLITTLALFFAAVFLSNNYLLVIIISFQFPIGVINAYISTLLQMEGQPKRYNVYGLINTIVNFILYVFLITVTHLRLEAIFIPNLVIGLGILAVEGFRLSKIYTLKLSLFNKKIIYEGLSYGLPQIGISVSAILLSIGDRYLIQYYYGERAVGEYSAGYRIGEMLILLPTGIIASVVAPLIFKSYEEDGLEKTKELIQNLYLAYIIIMLPFVIIFSFKPEFFLIIIGDKYIQSLTIIPSIIIGSFIFGICQFTGMFLQILGKMTTIMVLIILATITNLILNVILLKPLFIYGAALSTLIAYIVYFLLVNKFSLNAVKLYFINENLIRILLLTTPIIICILLCNFLLVSNFITIMLYILITFLYFCMELIRKDSVLKRFVDDGLFTRYKG